MLHKTIRYVGQKRGPLDANEEFIYSRLLLSGGFVAAPKSSFHPYVSCYIHPDVKIELQKPKAHS